MITDVFNIRYNPFSVTSINAFSAVKGGFNGNCKDVYFLRALGSDENIISDVHRMDEILTQKMDKGQGIYLRINALPKLVSIDDSTYYLNCYNKWIDSGKNVVEIKSVKNNQKMQTILSNAIKKTSDIFSKYGMVNNSIKRNFVVKLLFWFDSITKKFIDNVDKRTSVKIVANNVVKKQEYLFYYMLTQLGFDVLLIQNVEDIDNKLKSLKLSEKFVIGKYSKTEIPKYIPVHNIEASQCSANIVQSVSGVKKNIEVQKNNSVSQKREENIKANVSPKLNTNSVSTKAVHKRIENADSIIKTEKSFEELATLAKSVVMISIHNPNGEIIGVGSGIMIGKEGFILTNNHVAKDGVFYSVHIENDNTVYQTDDIIKYNPLLDLALIRINRILTPIPVYHGTKPLVRGQKVVAIGSPLGLFNTVSDGIISGFRKKSNEVRMIQFTAPISSGSSGGAVLNMFGEVIGISTAGIDEGQNLNLAMDYNYINPFIAGFI
ncbi:MAG: trypsin-like peptidase domain-containing protein [Acutalibacteraceae bacterium]|nr:trypsin-like peptidase domain-containing protein [Acutalibacteraceae bacterium]